MASKSIQERFEQFHAAHPEVFEEFRAIAQQLYDKGWRRYGAGSICEVLRFHAAVDGRDIEPYRINNNYRSRLARKLMTEYPHFEGFFETRKLRS